jgi:hypothetical protein
VNFGNLFNPFTRGGVVKTHRKRMNAAGEGILHQSAIGTAEIWNTDDDDNPGANFIAMATEDGGSETITGLGIFQKNLAVLSDNVVQIWSMRADPTLNEQLQVLFNTGTFATESVIPFGHEDLAYLDSTGIRSLRARVGLADLASVDDVGTPIDTYVQSYIDGLTSTQRAAACAVIDRDGRLWMAVGTRIFVYTSFPRAKINAWSTYEPGFSIDAMLTLNRRVYVRSGDVIYLYGGDNDATYDSSQVTITLPFFHDNKPGNARSLIGFDADLEGLWDVTVLVKPSDLTQHVDVGNLEGNTFEDFRGNVRIPTNTAYTAPKFISASAGYARISNFAVHYLKAPSEAAG